MLIDFGEDECSQKGFGMESSKKDDSYEGMECKVKEFRGTDFKRKKREVH